MRLLYTTSIFIGSALLFLVEPMIAKMLLPKLGGSPAVWNTCTLFFQGALLGGYVYAHLLTRHLRPRAQVFVHAIFLLAPALILPLHLASVEPPGDAPVSWIFRTLTTSVGLPFILIATTSPLLQRWFSETDDPRAPDPYFLYVASNAGNVFALFAYPLVLERALPLAVQRPIWSIGYGVLALATITCGVARLRRPNMAAQEVVVSSPPVASRVSARTRLRWIALSFIPSLSMLAVTQYLTTDIVSMPLVWMLPLFLYLLSFIIAFHSASFVPRLSRSVALPLVSIGLALVFEYEILEPGAPLVILHLGWLFLASLLCHGHLAIERPGREHLTEFYLLIGVGGVLGGAFSSLVAPIVFSSLAEYPFAVLLAYLACVDLRGAEPPRVRHLAAVVFIAVLVFGVEPAMHRSSLSPWFGHGIGAAAVILLVAMLRVPAPFAGGLGVILMSGVSRISSVDQLLHVERTFFGVHRVAHDPENGWNTLRHGTTIHGLQALEGPARQEPRLYYHPGGPIGSVFAEIAMRPLARIGIVGLGVGTLAAYGRSGQSITFFEIDPAIVRIAREPHYFSYVSSSPADVAFVVGDARTELARRSFEPFDLLVLDAFISDSIPIHLVTREALVLYLSKLAPEGLIAFNVSNRYLDLVPSLGALARDLGLVSAVNVQKGSELSEEALTAGKVGSTWVALAREEVALSRLSARDPRWRRYVPRAGVPVWTDDFTDIFSAFRLNL